MCTSAVNQVLVTALVTIALFLALPYPSNAIVPSWFTDCLNTHTSSCDGENHKFEWTCAPPENPTTPTCMSNAPISPPYVMLTKDPVQFTSQPQDSVLHGSSISLSCHTTGLSCFGQDDCPRYEWLHDGKTIPSSDYTNTANSSVLRIDTSETSKAGQYTCVVRYGILDLFTVASFPASVRTPQSTNSYFNWSSEINEDFITETTNKPFRTVTMEVPIGVNVILDCTVVKPLPSDCHVWSASGSEQFFSSSTCAKNFTQSSGANFKNIVALSSGNLAVYNFSQKLSGSYLCLMKRGTVIQQDKLYKLIAANSSSTALKFDASPRSQTVVEGSNVTLYCTASGGRPPLVYRWLRGSTPISPHEMPYGSSVLFLERVKLNQTGDYSCSVASNGGAWFVNKTAYLKVLAPIANVSIKLVSSNFRLNFSSAGDILLPPALNAGSLTLKCSLPFEQDDPKLTYTWLFRGQPIERTPGNSFVVNGSLLHVTVATQSDVRSVFGSVQCLMEGVGGRDSATVRIIENDKPNPPGPILDHKTLPQNYDYHYKLNWTESHSMVPVSDYQLKLYMYEIGVCSVTMSSSCLVYDGLCNIILENRDDTYDGSIGMRVSAIGEEGESTSDYSVFSHEAQYNKYCLVFSENIPPVTGLKESLVAHQKLRVYSGSLSWKPLYQSYNTSFTEEDEAELKYAYYVGLTCDGTALIDMEGSVVSSPVVDLNHTLLPSLNCAMQCSWFVSVSKRSSAAGDLYKNKITKYFTTPAFPPNVSGTLQSVNWADHSGSSFELLWQPPSKDLKSSSCLLEDTKIYNLTVLYQYSTNVVYSVNVTANYSDKVEPVRIPINQLGSCWNPFTVSVKFSNSAGVSPVSNELTLRSPQPSDISGFLSVTYNAETNLLNWTMDAAMRCFFERDYPYIRQFTIDIAIPNTNASKLNCSNVLESNWTSSSQYRDITFLKPDVLLPSSTTQFCITVKFFGNHDHGDELLMQQAHLVTVTNRPTASPSIEPSSETASPTPQYTIPTSPPTLLPAESSQTTKFVIALLVIVLLTVTVGSIVGIWFIIKKCKNCTKRRNSVELRTLPEGSAPFEVLIPKDDNLNCDSKSEHTTCNYLMGRFLEDSAKDQEQDDYLESVSVANDDGERAELNRASEASAKTGQMVEVELHNFGSGQEREIDDRTGKKILAENLEKSSKITSWKEEPKKNSRESLSLKTHQPCTTINIAHTPTLDQVRQIANTLQHSASPSIKTYSSVTSDYLANSCSTLGSSSSSQFGAEQRGPDVLTEKAVAALSDVLSYTSSQAPLTQTSACPSDVSPARSGYLSLESAGVLKSTSSPLHAACSLSYNIPEEMSLDLLPLDDSWAEENEDTTPTAERSGYSVSMQPRQQPNADGYITERSLTSFGTSTPSRLSTSSVMSSLSSTRDRHYSAGRDHRTASKDYRSEHNFRKHSLQEHRPTGDGYISEESLRHHSIGGLSLSLSKHEGSFSDYLPHSSFEHTSRKFSVADSAMASASPPDSLSQASSEQSVFLPEVEAEPSLSNPLPPPITTQLPRRRSDCSSGIFSSPTSPGVRSNTSGCFRPDPFTPYLSFPTSLPSSRPEAVALEKIKDQINCQSTANQRPNQLPMRQTDSQSKTQPHSATGTGLAYSCDQRYRYSSSTNYSDALNQRRASGGYPTPSSASSSRTLTPYSGATYLLPGLSPTRRTSLPSPSYSSYSPSYQKVTNHGPGSLSSTQSPTSPNNQGPSFLTYMYSTKPQTPTSNQNLSTAGPVEKPPSKQTYLEQERCKAGAITLSNSHESLSSSFDSSYSPSSSLEDFSCIDSSSSLPQSSCPPPPLSSSLSAKTFSRSSTKDSDDLWDSAMIQTVEQLEQQHLLQ